MEGPVQAARRVHRQIRAPQTLSCDGEGKLKYPKVLCSHCREKPLASRRVPVPETDTGRREEDSKARGRTLVKELGKMAP